MSDRKPPSAMDRIRYIARHPEKPLPIVRSPTGDTRPRLKLPVQGRCFCVHTFLDHNHGSGPCSKCGCTAMRVDPAYLLDPASEAMQQLKERLRVELPPAPPTYRLGSNYEPPMDPAMVAAGNAARAEAKRLGLL